MATEIRNRSRLEVKVNTDEAFATQWGVADIRTGKIIRSASTRKIARNFARRSSFYTIVKRVVFAFNWIDEKEFVKELV